MSDATGVHPSDEVLELYSLNRLPEDDSGRLEEHLLVCEDCRNRLREMDEFVAAMREALAERQARDEAAGRRRAIRASWWPPARPVWAGALAVVSILAFLIPAWRSARRVEEVQLQAWRGAAAAVESRAASGVPLVVKADIAGLPEEPVFRVELAGSDGESLWDRQVERSGPALVLRIDEGLDAGRYWLRIYSRSEPERLLREFGLVVQ